MKAIIICFGDLGPCGGYFPMITKLKLVLIDFRSLKFGELKRFKILKATLT